MNSFRLSLTMLWRDLRAGELTMLALALLVAVASLSSVGFLAERVKVGLDRDANQLLGGDLLVMADHPVPPTLAEQAKQAGLRVQNSYLFNSMASTDDVAQLAAVKAVESDYPLRGSLKIAQGIGELGAEAGRIPAQGEVWLEERLLSSLSIKVGDSVQLGLLMFKVTALVTFESDRGTNFFSFVPRLLMNAADLPATGLIQEGSRMRYRLHVAGDRDVVARLEAQLEPQLARGESIESIDNARPEVREGLDRAQRFLRLAAMLAVVLAAVATGLSARRFLQRHIDGCAVMRCCGAQRSQLLRLFLLEFFVFGFVVACLGSALGFAIQAGLGEAAARLVKADLPAPGWMPAVHGVLVGLALVLGFIAPQLLRLSRVSPVQVLRREWGAQDGASLGAWALGVLVLALLMMWIAADVRLGLSVVGGFAVACLVFALIAQALLSAAARTRQFGGWSVRYGLAALHRRRASSLVQIVALGLGLTAVLLLTVTTGDLLDSWRDRQSPDSPNRFVLNIQPEQRDPVAALLAARGLVDARLLPMIRGRLLAVNDKAVSADDYDNERAKRLVEREFNLSHTSVLQQGNKIVAGRWHGDGTGEGDRNWSMEEGLAKRLGIKVGDTLSFEIGGQKIEAPVGSLRKLDWDSMRVNFFVTAPPSMLAGLPASFITSFHLSAEQTALSNELVASFPNLTVIDVGAVLAQIRGLTERLVELVRAVFGFALLAGAVVLYAALQATHDERKRELSVLRTLGARNPQLRNAMLAEFLLLGLLSAALAVFAASGIGYVLAEFVFKIDYPSQFAALAFGGLLLAVAVTLLGWLGVRGLLRRTVVDGLRGTA